MLHNTCQIDGNKANAAGDEYMGDIVKVSVVSQHALSAHAE